MSNGSTTEINTNTSKTKTQQTHTGLIGRRKAHLEPPHGSQLTRLTRQTWGRKFPQRVHESGQWIVRRRHYVEEEAKQLATSVNLAVMRLRGNTGNLSTRIALGVPLSSEADEPNDESSIIYPRGLLLGCVFDQKPMNPMTNPRSLDL
jgi:hypothetical protein